MKKTTKLSLFGSFGLILIIAVILIFFKGCYLVKQGYYQVDLMSNKVPFSKVLADPSVPDEVKRKIKLVIKVKEFAVKEIGLKANDGYTEYIDLKRHFRDDKRRYVAYNLSAAPKDKLKPYLWKFPVVGEMPYLGFFVKEDAVEAEKELVDQGYDTKLRGVSAYSTLGFFSDPLFSSMLRYSDTLLANVVIHEMTHTTIFIADHVKFNEALAVFIGNKGSLHYFENSYGKDSELAQQARNEYHDDILFSNFMILFSKELEEYYNQKISFDKKIEGREGIFKKYQDLFKNEYSSQMKTKYYMGFPKLKLNNAWVLSFRRYYQDVAQIEKVYNSLDQDIKKTVDFFKELSTSDQTPDEYISNHLRK